MRLRQRTSIVVFVGEARMGDRGARELAEGLREAGFRARYLGREPSVSETVESAVRSGADTVEVCIAGGGALIYLRDLLRALKLAGRGNVSIVIHRLDP